MVEVFIWMAWIEQWNAILCFLQGCTFTTSSNSPRHVALVYGVLFDVGVMELHNGHGVYIHKKYHRKRVGSARY